MHVSKDFEGEITDTEFTFIFCAAVCAFPYVSYRLWTAAFCTEFTCIFSTAGTFPCISCRFCRFHYLFGLLHLVHCLHCVAAHVANHIHAHKGVALRQLAEYLGVPMSATMAVGDGLNDLTMLREAGIGVAMANACDEAKAAADVITESCDEDGVARAIERFCF